MDAKITVAAIVAIIPVIVYVYAMKRIVHATWAELLIPFRRQQKQGRTVLPAE
jgi:hypothetical protein